MTDKYCIRDGYISRKEYVQYDNTPMTEEFQKEVYQHARKLCRKNNFSRVLDIGCGSGYKLVKYFRDKNFTGLELEPNLSFLKEKYENFDWRLSDFSNPPKEEFDVIICSDVVEHLLEPNDLLEFINKINFKFLVMSTPERGVIQELQKSFGWKVEENGPPYNVHHVREWTFGEFKEYFSTFFNVEDHFMTPIQKECQVIVGSKK